jgi:3-phenylpropionate/cinnamic acid dioxygenase small subunit
MISVSEQEKSIIGDLLTKSCCLLDQRQFLEWAELFADDGVYELLFKSKEIGGKDDFLMKLDKPNLVKTLKLLPNHIVDTAKRLHMLSNINVRLDFNNGHCTYNFAIYRTTEAGQSSLYAVGSNEDHLVKKNDQWLFQRHRVVLDTRMLPAHTHIPL